MQTIEQSSLHCKTQHTQLKKNLLLGTCWGRPAASSRGWGCCCCWSPDPPSPGSSSSMASASPPPSADILILLYSDCKKSEINPWLQIALCILNGSYSHWASFMRLSHSKDTWKPPQLFELTSIRQSESAPVIQSLHKGKWKQLARVVASVPSQEAHLSGS